MDNSPGGKPGMASTPKKTSRMPSSSGPSPTSAFQSPPSAVKRGSDAISDTLSAMASRSLDISPSRVGPPSTRMDISSSPAPSSSAPDKEQPNKMRRRGASKEGIHSYPSSTPSRINKENPFGEGPSKPAASTNAIDDDVDSLFGSESDEDDDYMALLFGLGSDDSNDDDARRPVSINTSNKDPRDADSDSDSDSDDDMKSLFGSEPDQGVDTPDAMSCSLMPHQRIGLKWLLDHERGDRRGGILADDMGLGKTIQALALMLKNPPEEGSMYKTTLIVAPLALIEQWPREIETKVKPGHKLSVHVLHGTGKNISIPQLLGHDVVLTNYETLAADFKSLDTRSTSTILLHPTVQFYRVILDESHLIKNRKTFAARAAFKLNAKYRLAISGTPIMNKADEMFSLMCFLRIPDYMDWKYFNTHIGLHLRKKNARPAEHSAAQRKLNDFCSEMMLIRSKSDLVDGQPIINIPERSYRTERCQFDKRELAIYTALENKVMQEVRTHMRTKQNNFAYVLVRLLRLRQACCHLSLVMDNCFDDEEEMEEQDSDAGSESESGADVDGALEPSPTKSQRSAKSKTNARTKTRTEEYYRQIDKIYEPSTKIRKTLEILTEIRDNAPGEKALVFSWFTSFLDILVVALRRAGFGAHVKRYDGTMSPADKDAAVTEFMDPNSGTTILLLSLKSGNAGLNLNRANHVLFVEPYWNPFVETQAIDRAHRIGQTRPVIVYRLTIPKTIEERVLELQEKKKRMVGTALGTGVGDSGLTESEMLNLLRRSD